MGAHFLTIKQRSYKEAKGKCYSEAAGARLTVGASAWAQAQVNRQIETNR